MNRLPPAKRAQILHLLCEGNSMRATSRICDVSINTVTKLLIDAGKACSEYQDQVLVDLPCERLQVDEIWSFCYSKQRSVPADKKGQLGYGDVWMWIAICADTKLVPSWFVGSRDAEHCHAFIVDLSRRLANRVQLTSDGWGPYPDAVHDAFVGEINYAQLVKMYGESPEAERRYSPQICTGAHKRTVTGDPDEKHISTSYVERQNLTLRMSNRRFARLTNAFSKKMQNHVYSVSLHFMFYNFVKQHKSPDGLTPAMAAGVTAKLWSIDDIVRLVEDAEPAPKKRGPYKKTMEGMKDGATG